MDIIVIGTTIVSILVSFFKDALSETAKSSAKELFNFIKGKTSGSDTEKEKTQKLEKFPDDKSTQIEFQKMLEARMKADNDFAQELLKRLEVLAQNEKEATFKNVITGNVEKIVQINNLFGDIEL
jgi:hypothetical protein